MNISLKQIILGILFILPLLYLSSIMLDRYVSFEVEEEDKVNATQNLSDRQLSSQEENTQNSTAQVIPDFPIYPYELSTAAKTLLECGISRNYSPTLQTLLTELVTMEWGDDYGDIINALQGDDITDTAEAMAIFGQALEYGLGFKGLDNHSLLRDLAFQVYNDAFNAGSIFAGYQLAQGYVYYSGQNVYTSSQIWNKYPDTDQEIFESSIPFNDINVSLPREMSFLTFFPIFFSSPSISRMSSFIWKASPRFLENFWNLL